MTTLVYRDGVLAADTRAYAGDGKPIGFKTKIHKGPESAFGISTASPGLSEQIRDWFLNDKHFDHQPHLEGRSFEAIEVTTEGEVYFYLDNFSPSGPLTTEYIAAGSGSEYAIGALSFGATAAEAVAVAIKNDQWTDGQIMQIIMPFATSPEFEFSQDNKDEK